MKLSFIVEGDEDVNFLSQFVFKHFNVELERENFIVVGGKSETLKLVSKEIKASKLSGKLNVLIFDADDKDAESTKLSIKKYSRQYEIELDDIFLFPDNYSDGNLETLLLSAVTEKNKKIIHCIDSYVSCTTSLGIPDLRGVDDKEKVYIYHGTFKGAGNSKGTERDYLKENIWDLHADSLDNLKQFLAKHFNKSLS